MTPDRRLVLASVQSTPQLPRGSYCSDFFPHHSLELPVPEFRINELMQSVPFCVWLLSLSVMFWGFSPIVAFVGTLLLFTAGRVLLCGAGHTIVYLFSVAEGLDPALGDC